MTETVCQTASAASPQERPKNSPMVDFTLGLAGAGVVSTTLALIPPVAETSCRTAQDMTPQCIGRLQVAENVAMAGLADAGVGVAAAILFAWLKTGRPSVALGRIQVNRPHLVGALTGLTVALATAHWGEKALAQPQVILKPATLQAPAALPPPKPYLP